jgi:hypothetical protein
VPNVELRQVANQFREALADVETPQLTVEIFEAAKGPFQGLAYRDQVAEMLVNWHVKYFQLARTVADMTVERRSIAGFVLARPVFEAAMSLAWVFTAGESSWLDRYPRLLSLLEPSLVRLAVNMRSGDPRKRKRAEHQIGGLDEDARAFLEEAVRREVRGLPDVRSRIEGAEMVFSAERQKPTRLDGAYGFYEVLSEYGHPTTFGSRFAVDQEGRLQEDQDRAWELLPLMIVVRETSLLFGLIVEIAEWHEGKEIALGFELGTQPIDENLSELYRAELPPLLRGLL